MSTWDITHIEAKEVAKSQQWPFKIYAGVIRKTITCR